MSDDSRPAPLLEPLAAYARWARTYPPTAHNPLMRVEERAMLALLPEDLRGHTVFDAGCGSGRYLLRVLSRGATQVIGADLSAEMLSRAQRELGAQPAQLVRARIEGLPFRAHWADLTLCGLTIGHVPSLQRSLTELQRVTRPGGRILCSDVHPVGQVLGWRREFSAGGRRFAVRHHVHRLEDWERVCAHLGLRIGRTLEPHLEAADIPADAHFDRAALTVPVALVLELHCPRAGSSRSYG